MPDMVERPDIVRDNPNVPKFHSNFELKEVRQTTELFGLVKPHFVIDDVSTDDFEYRPDYRTRSYTLKAPLMQNVHRKLSYVKVDLSSILPLNYEKFYTNPVVGDDVPNDCGVVVSGGYKKISDTVISVLSYAFTGISGANNFTSLNLTLFLKALIFAEMFYSRGSLLSSLGSHITKQLKFLLNGKQSYFDATFDYLMSQLLVYLTAQGCDYLVIRDGSRVVNVAINTAVPATSSANCITFRDFLNFIRSTGDWEVMYLKSTAVTSFASDWALPGTYQFVASVGADVPFNFGRVCAYQLAVAEYMTNDKVDHIYSAELYRQYIGSLLRDADLKFSASVADFPKYFICNGITYQYDFLSGKYLTDMLSLILINRAVFLGNDGFISLYEYFISLFAYKRSLRYKDYFVSSRVHPLAVGSVDVTVNNNAVSVIDISRNIQVQRFLNAVNHSGRKLSNYIKTFFGINIAPDRHVPHWLADIDELVYTAEVENTGVAQQTNPNSVTATFTANSGNKMLHFYADLPGYIIGLTSYDIERSYADTIDRSFFIEDRFDMFLPEMQFVGDQAVLAQELDASDTRAFGSAFGYQYRDMQYKLLYAVADGGFPEFLPGYAFIYNPDRYARATQSPDFIRSKVGELDEFYLSLTGYSLASYFHFISIITNNVSAKRPMIANPKILE